MTVRCTSTTTSQSGPFGTSPIGPATPGCFFQTEAGGKTAAVLASLLQTARAIGLDPKTYFRASETDVTKLTPHGWKQHFAKDVADHHEDILCRLRDHLAAAM